MLQSTHLRYSCLLGRPTSLDPRFSDTRPPRNINLSDILAGQDQPKSHDEPTFATYLILRRGLGEIVAKVTEHFQLLSDPVQYRDVEAIDADFKDFVASLPPAFSMTDPDKSWDDSELAVGSAGLTMKNYGSYLFTVTTFRRKYCISPLSFT